MTSWSSSPCANWSSRGRRAPTAAPKSSPSKATWRRRCGRSASRLRVPWSSLRSMPWRGWRGPAPAAAPTVGAVVLQRDVSVRSGWSPRSATSSTTGRPTISVTSSRALRWWWWDAHEPVTGWQLQLTVEDPTEGVGLGDQRSRCRLTSAPPVTRHRHRRRWRCVHASSSPERSLASGSCRPP